MFTIGDALVKFWAATILDCFTKLVAVITPAIRMPITASTAESSIRVKAEDLNFMIFLRTFIKKSYIY
jgi:hypothetical protein